MSLKFVVTDGATDNSQVIQSALDAAVASPTAKRVRLPAGDILIDRPLVIRGPDVTLCGSEDGPTRLFGSFAGHAVLAQAPRAFGPDLGPSLVPGPGAALRVRPGGPANQKPVCVTTEPNLDLSGAAEFSVSYFLTREAPAPNRGVHFRFGGDYGHRRFGPLAVWDWDAGLAVEWGGVFFVAPGWAQDVGVAYHVTVSYKAGVVRLWVGRPGQPAVLARSFQGDNQFRGGGVEPLSFGYQARGPLGDVGAFGGPDGWLDGFYVSRVGLDAPFTCPAVKPEASPQTRFLMNFVADGPFLAGQSANGRPSFVLPNSPQTHMGGVEVSDLTFMGGISGPCLYDCIYSRLTRLGTVQSHVGFYLRGTTYGGVFRDIHGNAMTYAWLQGDQSMQTLADSLKLGSLGRGVIFYAAGAVGGSFRGLHLTPHAPCVASLFLAETNDFNLDNGQVDDEGQAGDVGSVALLDREAWVKFNGVLLARHTDGSLLDLCGGSSAHLAGSWFSVNVVGPSPQIHFRDTAPPVVPVTIAGILRRPANGLLTNKPQFVSSLTSV